MRKMKITRAAFACLVMKILIQMSGRETIYDINLDTRIIDSPKFIGVEKDHAAETIYFKVDRYYDYMDLANTICII